MSILNTARTALVTVPAFAILTGCALFSEPPLTAEQQQQLQPIQDLRPQLLFSLNTNEQAEELKVYVNTLYVGTVADFNSATRPLRLLSGEHTIQIRDQDEVLLQETLELESGAVRVMHVPDTHNNSGA